MDHERRVLTAVAASSMLLAAPGAGGAAVAGDVATTVRPSSGTVAVTSGADSGPGSFRAAVEQANVDPSTDTIRFRGVRRVALKSAVEFTGSQDLTIDGHGSRLSGSGVEPDTESWDGGLLLATGGADLTVRRLGFFDSFNNGLAVLVPEGSGALEVSLDRVAVRGTQFHGVLIDGQSTSGYNTDDIAQPGCTDPYPVDAGVNIRLDVDRTLITDAGRIEGFDTSIERGCPQDFDGLRVDQGGDGGISGRIERSAFRGNLADGAELDETGSGGVRVRAVRTLFSDNGDTEPVACPAGGVEGCPDGEEALDLDDGFDIDETGGGDLRAVVVRTLVDGNLDEGLDFDEAGGGHLVSRVRRVSATGNTDQAFKASEEGSGDNVAVIRRSRLRDGGADGAEIEEADAGTVRILVARSQITDNDGFGIVADEDDTGENGTIRLIRSNLRNNVDGPLDLDDVDLR